ncbi:hypothetical protein [Rossellomorea aquimaris]|uniref:hypothetical protein n=1 Tax=Rossellomorea aquimaris TaxID=189382 RepID=UPI001CFE067F|nr:hypothetical protein [Rossellomorea aquimaris]
MKRFRVAFVKEGEDIGVGMEMYNDDLKPVWIGSYYLKTSEYSRRDVCQFYIARAREHLAPGEVALLKVADSGVRHKKNWYSFYSDVQIIPRRFGHYINAHNLAIDATRRKTTITEKLGDL